MELEQLNNEHDALTAEAVDLGAILLNLMIVRNGQ